MEIEAQPLPFQQPRVPASCDRHPDQPVTGFCASCLRERLTDLEAAASVSAPRKSTSAIKSIFLKASGGCGHPSASGGSSLLRPELRRCKSFSGSRGPLPTSAFEPQRKSCDVRGRNTLWSLFHQADRNRSIGSHDPSLSAAGGGEIDVELDPANLGFPSSSVAAPVLEAHEEEDYEDDEIRPADDPVLTAREIGGIEEAAEEEEEEEEKSMKDHINLESQSKKASPKEMGGGGSSFWLAASVFSKKLQKWRQKQKLKKQSSKAASAAPQDKSTPKSSRRFRETQSEVAVDAFGRRSCDIDPRFSLDAGRMSVDGPRFSWDAPRASWDGHLIGSRSVLPRLPPMLAVGEDAAHIPAVERWDGRIPVEEDAFIPGGCVQTRDYYFDSSSSRRRRSLDRSNSLRKLSFELNEPKQVSNAKVSPAVRSNSLRKLSFELNEPKQVSNAKVSPAGGTEYLRPQNGSKHERDSKEFSSNSLRDDHSESFGSSFRDPQKEAPKKKSRKWSKAWNIWGLIYRRGGGSRGDGAAHAIERSFSETWPELPEQVYNDKIFRCNSSVSSRNCSHNNSGFGSMRRSNAETNGHGKKRQGEFVLERSKSTRYSPSHVDNGLLRFYLTPMRNSRRNGFSGRSRHINTHSFTRTMLGMY